MVIFSAALVDFSTSALSSITLAFSSGLIIFCGSMTTLPSRYTTVATSSLTNTLCQLNGKSCLRTMKESLPVFCIDIPPEELLDDDDEDELEEPELPPVPIVDEPPLRSNVVNLAKPVWDLTLNGPTLITAVRVLLIFSTLAFSSGDRALYLFKITWLSLVAAVTSSPLTETLFRIIDTCECEIRQQ